MKKKVIYVQKSELLADEIEKILEKRRKQRKKSDINIYLDEELSRQLVKKFNTVYVGKYNFFLGEKHFGFKQILLIRIKTCGKYVAKSFEDTESEIGIFFCLQKEKTDKE